MSAGRVRGARLLMGAVLVVGLVVDQLTKQWAIGALTPGEPVPFVGRALQFYLIRNPGAAFSLGEGATVVFAGLALAVLVGLVGYALPRVQTWGWAVALGLLGAGVAGNLSDRLFRPPAPFHGHVVDFLMLPRWPIFNVADMLIDSAAVVIVVLAFRTKGEDGPAPAAGAERRSGTGRR